MVPTFPQLEAPSFIKLNFIIKFKQLVKTILFGTLFAVFTSLHYKNNPFNTNDIDTN